MVEAGALAPQDESRGGAPEPFAVVQGFPISLPEVRYLLSRVSPITTQQHSALDRWLGNAAALPDSSRPSEQATPATGNRTAETRPRQESAAEKSAAEKSAAEKSAAAEPVRDALLVTGEPLPAPIVAAATEQWVERLLVLSFLQRQRLAVPVGQVESDLRHWDKALKQQGSSLDEYRGRWGISYESLLRHRHWELSWQAYVDRRLTPESLNVYFQNFHREFDGTRRQVAHLVKIVPAHDASAQSRDAVRRELQAIGQRIESGALSFAQATAAHSEGASAAIGGDLGWIHRDGPLTEALSQAAFRLSVGQVSPPIDSPHGVHLLTVLAEEPGELGFDQVQEQVYQAALRDLWRTILEQERPNVSIVRAEPKSGPEGRPARQ
jgi:parvulin-like peptidyl-prolyl isomerase